MTKWTDKELLERRVILQRAAMQGHLPEYAVEKDWWASMTLKALFRTSCKDYLEFKGGTSLSKGWHLIDRFSEDIDVALNHQFFVPQLDNNTQVNKLRKKSRKFIVDSLAEDLNSQMKGLGLSGYEVVPEIMDEAGNPISSDADPTVIYVNYPSVSSDNSSYVQQRVKIEISCLSMDEPFELRTISSIISSFFPEDDGETECIIPVVLPSRTFLEKAFLLNEEFQKTVPRSLRMTRHLYDLEKLMDTEFGEKALSDMQLYSRIVEHRRKFYHAGYADYDKDYPDAIVFLPPERCIKQWKTDYYEMQEHFVYGQHLSFEALIKRISELQDRFRAHALPIGRKLPACGELIENKTAEKTTENRKFEYL